MELLLKYNKSKKLFYFTLISSIATLCILFLLSLYMGRYQMTLNELFGAIFTNDPKYSLQRSIIEVLRLPRAISSIFVGAALSLSGLIYQEIFQNKLVSPDLLGVSSGAGLGAAIGFVCGVSLSYVGIFAFIFGILSVLSTLFISKTLGRGSSVILLLSGVVVGGFMSSALSMVKFFADQETTLSQITFWLMGSFSSSKMSDLYILVPVVSVGCIILILFRNRINVLSLGKEDAQASGVSYSKYKIVLILLVTLLTAICISFYGTISWIGLVIPHIVRLLVGRETKYTIPITIVVGAIFLLGTDIISRSFTASEIPISAVTGLIGTPIFILIISLKRNKVE